MSLKDAIQAVIDETKIEAGVSVRQIETGEQTDINAGQPFPMASVFKIPVLATAGLQLVAGKLSLEDRIPLKDEDKSVGSGILPFFQSGLTPTFRDLLTLMIIISDNTATDINVALLGGPLVIEQTMHGLGLKDIYLKLDCKGLLADLFPADVRALPHDEIEAWSNTHDILRDGVTFSRGPENNVSTAAAMTELVTRFYQGQIVDDTVKDELMEIMFKQQFNQRLPRFLPSGTKFAHKTGTIGGFANDSGVMVVSDEIHVAVTLFTCWDDAAVRDQPFARVQRTYEVETAMGKIGRLVYDHYAQ